MDVHVCIHSKSIAAVSLIMFSAPSKEMMGDRDETTEATAAQRSFKRGGMVKMARRSSAVTCREQQQAGGAGPANAATTRADRA
jgi:hypothetical protein